MVGKEKYTKEEIQEINLDKEELRRAKTWISNSEQDLQSSNILFEHKKHPNAVREFQQSVEKTTKAFILIAKALRSDELRKKISHSPLEKFYVPKIKENLKKAEDLEKAIEENPSLKEMDFIKNLNLKNFKQKSEFAEKKITNFIKRDPISNNEENLKTLILGMEDEIKKVKEMEKKQFTKEEYNLMKKAWENNIESFCVAVSKKENAVSEEEKKQALSVSGEMIEHLAKRMYKNLILSAITNALNTLLNLIIEPHFKLARYPDVKDPLKYYSDKNPLIKLFNKLIKIQKENISFHKKYLEFVKDSTSEIVME